MIRIDFIFSNWIFIWTILYVFFSTKIPSPFLILIIALVLNILEIVYLLAVKVPTPRIIKYLVVIFIAKGVPIGLLYYYFNSNIKIYNDIIKSFLVFAVYNIYLFVNNTDFITINKDIVKSIIKGDNNTPIFHIIDKYFS